MSIERIDDFTLLKKTQGPTIAVFEWESEIYPIMKPYSQVRQMVFDLRQEYMNTFGEPDYAGRREEPLSIIVRLWYILQACIRIIPLPPTLESRMFFVDEIPIESIQYAAEVLESLILHKTRIESLIQNVLREIIEDLIETLEAVLDLCKPIRKMKVLSASKFEMMSKYLQLKDNLDKLVMDLKVVYTRYLEEGDEQANKAKYAVDSLFFFRGKLWQMLRHAHLQIRANQTDSPDGSDYFEVMERNFSMIDELHSITSELLKIGAETIIQELTSTSHDNPSHIRKIINRALTISREINFQPVYIRRMLTAMSNEHP